MEHHGMPLPPDERVTLLMLFKMDYVEKIPHVGIELLCEKIKHRDRNRIEQALENLKEMGYVDYTRTFSEFIDIKLTGSGRMIANNRGLVPTNGGNNQNFVNMQNIHGNVGAAVSANNAVVSESFNQVMSFTQIHTLVETVHESKKPIVKKAVLEIENELKKEEPKMSIITQGLKIVRESGEKIISDALAAVVKSQFGLP